MTDLATLLGIFEAAGFSVDVHDAGCNHARTKGTHVSVEPQSRPGARSIGYPGFTAEFVFDETGRLVAIGGYE